MSRLHCRYSRLRRPAQLKQLRTRISSNEMYILSCTSWIVAERSLLLLWPVQRGMTELRGEFRRQIMFGRFLLLVLLLPLRYDLTKHCEFRPLSARLMKVDSVLVAARACFLAGMLHLQNRRVPTLGVQRTWASRRVLFASCHPKHLLPVGSRILLFPPNSTWTKIDDCIVESLDGKKDSGAK